VRPLSVTVLVILFFVLGAAALMAPGPRLGAADSPRVSPRISGEYATTIQPMLSRRCVVCHSCYDSPCQLNLQSFEGLDRGATTSRVYEPSRLLAVHPTRMFQDAQTTAEWQARFGFFPVLERLGPSAGSLDGSLLWSMVQQRRDNPVRVAVNVDDRGACPPTVAAAIALQRADPGKGMPYGLPPIGDDEARALGDWLRAGAGGPPPPDEPAVARDAIARWESFFDARDPRSRLVARYVYEHLFLAHLAIEQAPGEWFRLVRSRTASPAPIDEIATVRPYDDPRTPYVHYRLRRVTEAIVEKTHSPYLLSDAKLARFRQLFFSDPSWSDPSPKFPSYEPDVAANPFVAFAAIPPRARYQFLLDDAYYHVRTFIHGPVCKGQVALDVIDEHFLIFFLSPAADPTVAQTDFLARSASELAVPAEGGDGVEAIYERFKLHELGYLRDRAALLRRVDTTGHMLSDVWNGDGANTDAALTVYRHFDSAFVLRGAVGGQPKTAWVLDYPIFERLYYDLVAGFDVFGNVVHQLSTRRYMNLLRIEAESSFLAFLPASQRKAVRDSWYRPSGVSRVVDVLEPGYAEPETRVTFADPANAKDELVARLVDGVPPHGGAGAREPIQWAELPIVGYDAPSRFERAARTFVRKQGAFVAAFPDTALVRVVSQSSKDAIYTIVRNKEHLNIDFLFAEDEERAPAEDTLHVVRGVAASRPNLFLVVNTDEPERFAADVLALGTGGATWSRFLDRYGVRRDDPLFWTESDFFNERYAQVDSVSSGILDLSRYTND
jgi:Fatty acid cis/trans isomerase (CTI)